MASATPPPPGMYVPVPTFFASRTAADYDEFTPPLDLETQAAHSIYLAKSGIRGLVILGSTGESVHIHPRDRKRLLSHVRAALDKEGYNDYPIIAGTATHSVEETVEQLEDTKAAGSQWGMVLAPGYNAPVTTADGIVKWFTAVANKSPIPILVYHFPGVSNMVKIPPSSIVKLSQHQNIVGCKLSHGDISQLTQIALNPSLDASHFRVYTGLGQQLSPAVTVGCAGAIDGSAGFFPKSLVRLYELSTIAQPSQEDIKARQLLQFKVSCMEEIVVKYGVVGIKEAIARLRGFGDTDGTRLPLSGGIPGGEVEWKSWNATLDAVEEVEGAL